MSIISKAFFKRIFSLHIAYYLTFSLISSLVLGVFYRFFPSFFVGIGLNPEKVKFLGTIFITLMRMIISPLIFFSVISSVLSVGDVKEAGKLALHCLVTFLVMTLISVIIGIVFVQKIQPGKNVSFDKSSIFKNADMSLITSAPKKVSSVGEFILEFVPRNIFESIMNDNFLQIIFFSILFAISAMKVPAVSAKFAVDRIKSMSEIILGMSKLINYFAPFGIFGMTFWMVGTQDIVLLKSLGKLIFCVYSACIIVVYGFYSLFAIFCLHINPIHFFRKMIPSQMIGLLLTSSSAALPLSLDIAKNRLGVRKDRADFIIPLGSTMNMNGGAVYFGAVILFISQLFGVDMTPVRYLLLIVLSTFAAVGTAPVPNSAVLLLPGLLTSMGLPIEAIAIMLPAERIFNMARVFTNISGDVFSAVAICKSTSCLDEEMYNAK